MQEIGYKINTEIAPELPSEIAKRKHLKSHSEKKALAVLLKQKGTKNIKIKVFMRMCQDCHQFFCAVSKKYSEHDIQCVDPKGIHLFKHGVCYLCD